MATTKKLLQAAAGNAGGDALNVEDVFSTYLYTGNSTARSITNGIDLAGEGGLTWIKSRSSTREHSLYDTERGVEKLLKTNSTGAEQNTSGGLTSFNSNGFSLGTYADVNGTSYGDFASWTFRKAPKFFTCLTYSGTGSAGLTIDHDLGSFPGCIMVKRLDAGDGFQVYHRGSHPTAPEDYKSDLSTTMSFSNDTMWNDFAPTDTQFQLGARDAGNKAGTNYVAYLFAHNDGDGEFGPDADADIIKCGSYTGNGSTNGPEIDLGFEPQWVLIKEVDDTGNWQLFDSMRGMVADGSDARIAPNLSSAEDSIQSLTPTATGFKINTTSGNLNTSGSDHIYIAIRRGTKVPESGTEVFDVDEVTAVQGTDVTTNFSVDAQLLFGLGSTYSLSYVLDRLRGVSTNSTSSGRDLEPNNTNAESSETLTQKWGNTGFQVPAFLTNLRTVYYNWKRAPSYMDCVAYFGNGTAGRTVSHNLGVAPEMVWYKNRSDTINWIVYHKDIGTDSTTQVLELDTSDALRTSTAFFNSTAPSASVLTLGTASHTNYNTNTYIAYLFATLAGISKVGSYTGNGSFQTIDCGFSAGSRFVLIKRTDATGDWYVWDSVRGITQNADPYLELNTTAAETTGNKNYLYPVSSGFGVQEISGTNNPNINVSSATYIFYAIA